jgi:hypothetical protein
MEPLESFVAAALLRRLGRAAPDDRTAGSTSFRGAVLFVDISNYTALAESLCARGPEGVEELGKILDGAFAQHVRAVDDTGGEIACFAGDAFIAYWSADDNNVSRALGRAHECARLLHGISRRTADSDTPSPQLHIGVGAGDLWAARLGNDDRWQFLLAGRPVRDACAAAARAGAGETVIAPAVGPFAASSPADALPSPDTSPDLAEADQVAALRPLVHQRIHKFAGDAFADWIAERRTIYALFIRLNGLDETAPDALARHQAAVASLNIALRPFTSSSGTLLLDDKGLVFTLCFGMPHETHADDAVRAVRAALAVGEELARVGITCAAGVSAGTGVCMTLGGPPRRHYWAVGRFMHVAARLMSAPTTGVLCTDEVADRVRRAVSLTPEAALTLKGLRWPVRVFRVGAAVVVDTQTEVLYGREDEQAQLDQYLTDFEQGIGRIVWLVGDAGIGKTTLVHHLRRTAARRGIECLSGAAGSVEVDVPYAAWRPVFATLLDLKSAEHLSQAARLERIGTIRHPQLASLVNAVMPGFLEETPVVQSVSGQARADATATVLSEIITARVADRFVLILEDCHWMDAASSRLLLRIGQDNPRALIVATCRPGADVEGLGVLKRLEQPFAEMALSSLRKDAIRSLVEGLLAGQSPSQELLDQITARAVGNPLFAREYALLLATDVRQRDLVAGTATRSTPPQAAESMPVTVQQLIASRLDALAPPEALALKAASVIGDRFSPDLLAAVYPVGNRPEPLDGILARLSDRRLIVSESIHETSYVFQHALIREVTYEQLTTDQRRNLHRRAALAIEHASSGDPRQDFALLARHWQQAAVPRSAIEYSDRAASQALAAGAFDAADRLLGVCIQLTHEHSIDVKVADQIRWYRQLADARNGMGQLESRSAAAHHALRLARRPRSQTSVGRMSQAMRHLGRLALGRSLPTSWQIVDRSPALDVARAYRHSAEVCYFNNDMLGMICDSVSAIACATPRGPSAVLAGASTELGGILSVAGLRRLGERMLERSIVTAEAAHEQAAQAYAHMISCLYYVGVGDWDSAKRSAHRCQELCEPMDDRVNWTNAQAVRFWMSHYRSDEAAAFDAARRLRDRASETGNRQHRAWAYRFLALCALRRDDAREAIAHLEAGLDCLGETAAINERVPTLGILALAQLRAGDVWPARATAAAGLSQAARVRRPIGHSTLEGYSSLLTVALNAWDDGAPGEWKTAARTCLRILERYRRGFPVGEPRYQLHRADYLQRLGLASAARRRYKRGEAAATRLGMPWDAKRCRESLLESGSSGPRQST